MNDSAVHIPLHLLPEKETPIYLAISGGVDSSVLLHLLSELDNPIHTLHVNYHLRGRDSKEDEMQVRSLSKKYNAQVSVLNFNLNKHLKKNGGNLQNEARKIRYTFFKEKLKDGGVLMTAHHLNDQMETFFMHLSRKSGIAGMSCMTEKNGNHIRPLLNFHKNELYEFARQNKVEFREDKSNLDNKYLRNLWRNDWIPKLEKQIPNLSNSIQILIEAFQNERLNLEGKYKSHLKDIIKKKKWDFFSFDSMCQEGKHLIARELDIRPSELKELEKLRLAGKSKKLEISRQELSVWNSGESFLFRQEKDFQLPKLNVTKVDRLPQTFDKNKVYLDTNKVKGGLGIRKWQANDRILSAGMTGSQLVSDVIKDAKVEPHLKSQVLVVEDETTIIWVVGLKVGRTALATKETNELALISVEELDQS